MMIWSTVGDMECFVKTYEQHKIVKKTWEGKLTSATSSLMHTRISQYVWSTSKSSSAM